jgi:Na+-translocating ferredoxin:NAD+ oxidoreductase RnfG subunit
MKTVFSCIFMCASAAAAVVAASLPAHTLAIEYTTPQALLAQRFRSSERVTFLKLRPSADQLSALQARLGRALPKPEYTFFVATSHGQPDGYALFDDQIGQHEPISFATFFDPKGEITGVEVVAYREPYGDGIRAERFRKQFMGRTARSAFRSGTDIDAIAGATISSRSMCIGVERAAALFEIVLRANGGTVASR